MRRLFAPLLVFLCCAGLAAQDAGSTETKTPIATVSGQPIYEDDLASTTRAQLLPLERQAYEIKKKALDSFIDQKIVEAAAKKKNLTPEELVRQEVDAKVPEPTEGEIQGYYLALRERVNRPLDDVRDQLQQVLKQAKIQQARQDFVKTLRNSTDVAVFLAPPKVQVASDPKRMRGNPSAPVMIVEFSDYQCPYCRQAETTVKDLLKKYGDKVSLSYRDFPLNNHPHARLAAEASRCAGEQGKFWEYHDQLFSASDLQRPALVEYARSLKLDAKQFESCIDGGKYKAEVERDLQDGMQAGVSGTPGFFINGVAISGAQPPAAFIRLIESELDRNRRASQ